MTMLLPRCHRRTGNPRQAARAAGAAPGDRWTLTVFSAMLRTAAISFLLHVQAPAEHRDRVLPLRQALDDLPAALQHDRRERLLQRIDLGLPVQAARSAAAVHGRPPHGGSRSPRCWPWSGAASFAAVPRPGPAGPASSWPRPRRRPERDHARAPGRRGSARRRARTHTWHGLGSMLLAPEPREVESSPHSPPTSLTVKISDGGRDCGGSGKNHAVKSYGDQETLTGIADL